MLVYDLEDEFLAEVKIHKVNRINIKNTIILHQIK